MSAATAYAIEPAPAAEPEVKGGVVAYLMVDGAMKAAEFYAKAFGAEVAAALPVDESGRSCHVHLHINGASVMLSDFYPEHGCGQVAAQGFNLMMPVSDTDASFERAIEAGCSAAMPPADMFWGARYAQVRDPFGVTWAFNQHKA